MTNYLAALHNAFVAQFRGLSVKVHRMSVAQDLCISQHHLEPRDTNMSISRYNNNNNNNSITYSSIALISSSIVTCSVCCIKRCVQQLVLTRTCKLKRTYIITIDI